MSRSVLADAFEHHVWATLQLVDACTALSPDQLGSGVPGTYGSILETMRHLVGADASYLFILTDGRRPAVGETEMGLPRLRKVMEDDGAAWTSFLALDIDPDRVVVRHRDDGSEGHAPLGIRLAQALHHGTDHRSQICTALTTLGIEPPPIDVWDFAEQGGRFLEVPPGT